MLLSDHDIAHADPYTGSCEEKERNSRFLISSTLLSFISAFSQDQFILSAYAVAIC
jgi:hypothetical protein